MSGVLGGNLSISNGARDVGCRGTPPSNDVEARDVSHHRPVSWRYPRTRQTRSIPHVLQCCFLATSVASSRCYGYEAGTYRLHLSKLPSSFGGLALLFVHVFHSYKFLLFRGGYQRPWEPWGAFRHSIGRIRLELPPCSLVVGTTPRPTTPRLERGMGLCLRLLSPLYFFVFVHANAWFFGFSGLRHYHNAAEAECLLGGAGRGGGGQVATPFSLFPWAFGVFFYRPWGSILALREDGLIQWLACIPPGYKHRGRPPWRHQVIWRSVHPEPETLDHQSSSSS
jgi:hypothetical protein